jgi:hypothetical protein
MRSVGGVEAYEPVGSATGSVPAGGARTRFDIPYTFRPDDGVAGKVTFRATAVIEGGRDAAPADNTVTSVATIVRR